LLIYEGFSLAHELETGGLSLGKIHRKDNDKKYFCYFTGFLEGIIASGLLESGEVEPLIAQCEDFAANTGDGDAVDLLEDFKADLLEHETIVGAVEYRDKLIDAECPKSSVNRLYGYFAGIACDDLITFEEAVGLVERVDKNLDLKRDPLIAALAYCCVDALEDGMIDTSESTEICRHISFLVGDCYADTGLPALGNVPVFSSAVPPNLDELKGLVFVLSGQFSVKPRSKIEQKIRALGGVAEKSITRRTDYLVVASEASRDWVITHRGNKILKAEGYRARFGSPLYLSEAALLRMLGGVE
jgi:hypothetical protein